jgi:16S rRNA (guanine527-N7)-methyltransferase
VTAPVSRETPATPPVALTVFGERLPLAEQYVAALASDGIERGLIGPNEGPRLWERHVLGCALVSDLVESDRAVCDIGSGAGLPGIPLAIRRPDLRLTLVEPLQRRAGFLNDVVAALRLDNVEVVRARAEHLHGERRFPVVTSRAVAPIERLLSWSLPLVAAGGAVLAMKGRSAPDEAKEVQSALAAAGLPAAEVIVLDQLRNVPPPTVVRVEVGRTALLRWPQHSGARRRKAHP